ncbi:hypothetical protein HAHE_27590 [Haloferula helveola]|uniref:Verru_Chthon cassette protein A n=2 Tax=Haloferula helveola TaxID=490095 RepID=A0ABM7RFF9_9BACT|nr:hypothetical protein HAHE_27590 [Haloferula helveola]
MVLLALLAVGLLGLSTISLRATSHAEARAVALANARLGLSLAIGQLQADLGDDRRTTADAAILGESENPNAVGVWNGWSPKLGDAGGDASRARIDYQEEKGQEGFHHWLVSDPDVTSTGNLDWHLGSDPDAVPLFDVDNAGFELSARRIPIDGETLDGAMAWAVSQENTKAKINMGTEDGQRTDLDDRLHTPARPNLTLSTVLEHPEGDWERRSALVTDLRQAALDSGYGVTPQTVARAGADYTTQSLSVLSNPVDGGLKVDLSTGFELPDEEFEMAAWSDASGQVGNPFRLTDRASRSSYDGQRPLWKPLASSAEATVFMNFPPASVHHKFQVNGVPTFDMLRAHYRTYRHLYHSDGGGLTTFERPYSHVATPGGVRGRPFGSETQPSLAPVLDRMNVFFSIFAKADGTLGILLSPVITLWNPHNVAIESEGLVVYPWIDFAVWWNWSVTPSRSNNPMKWHASLSRFVGEGYQGHGRSSRPYFYLHLTEDGVPPRRGTPDKPLRLEPGEVRVFTLADGTRRDLEVRGSPDRRTWYMRPAASASDITRSLKGGIVLDMTKSINGQDNFNYKLRNGDRVNANTVTFDRGSYFYLVNMADSYQIKNPRSELMADSRPAGSGLPNLRAEPNLYLHAQIHSGTSYGKADDRLTYPAFRFEEIKEEPHLIGSLLTYHRVARSSSLPLSDLMFTTNPRQGTVNPYLSGAKFQTGPHYETIFRGGTSLAQLAMETTFDGQQAFYGPSHSAASGLPFLPFFDVPQSPILSLGALQHCDVSTTAFTTANQIGNSWASAYLPATTASRVMRNASTGERIESEGLSVYDSSYLANEALFDGFYFSGATPTVGSRNSNQGTAQVWEEDQIGETEKVTTVLERFFDEPREHPLRNPRLVPYHPGVSDRELGDRLEGPARCVRLASHLMLDGGFNVNSTKVEAWKAMLLSLRGALPDSADTTPQSRFRHIIDQGPAEMVENDVWCGFRSLTDPEIEELAERLVEEVRERGPFLSLGEFVNRQVTRSRGHATSGAIQAAIDSTNLNRVATQSRFDTRNFPNPENLRNPDTGTNLPGWLSQADVLTPLAPYLTTRSDTFIIRSLGEARDPDGKLLAQVRLEAVVQRVPEFVNPTDTPETAIADLDDQNKNFGRRFRIVSYQELP